MITIFYHQHAINDYMDRFQRTYNKIVSSGLLKETENFYVVSDDPNKRIQYDGKVKPIFYSEKFLSEAVTINRVKQNAIEKPTGLTLYLHSKGVSHPTSQNVQDWVDLMEYFLIEKWTQIVNDFKRHKHETDGVNYTNYPEKHYSGNFWWARNSYLATLPDVHPIDRLRCEMWVCQKVVYPECIYKTTVNHYQERYPRELYAN